MGLNAHVTGCRRNLFAGDARVEEYDFEFFGKKKPSLLKRISYQTLRYVLVAGFLYVTYLGFTMRNIGVTQTPPIE